MKSATAQKAPKPQKTKSPPKKKEQPPKPIKIKKIKVIPWLTISMNIQSLPKFL